MATAEQLADEDRRARKLRHIVDIATVLLMQSNMTRPEAEMFVSGIRERILTLFPDGESAYEIIYAPRFRRLVDEYAPVVTSDRRGVVIPFPIRQV
jgi:hypothetical protein